MKQWTRHQARKLVGKTITITSRYHGYSQTGTVEYLSDKGRSDRGLIKLDTDTDTTGRFIGSCVPVHTLHNYTVEVH